MKNPSRSHFFRLALFLSPLPLLLVSPVFASGLYKCAGEQGIPAYQDTPCAKGKELRDLSKDDSLSVIPMKVEPSRLPPPAPATAAPPTPSPAPPVADAAPSPAPPPALSPPAGSGKEPVAHIAPLSGNPPAGNDAAAVLGNVPATPLLPPTGAPPVTEPAVTAAMAPPGAAATRMAIKPGMTAAEVEAKLGPPPMTGGGDAPDLPVRWFYLPVEGDQDTITTIVLQKGKVTDVERKPMKKNQPQ